jgi:hypothetical protein
MHVEDVHMSVDKARRLEGWWWRDGASSLLKSLIAVEIR